MTCQKTMQSTSDALTLSECVSLHVLRATPPFEFRHMLRFLGGFTPAQGEQHTAGELHKATRLNGQTVGFVVREGNDTELTCELVPERPLTTAETSGLLEWIRHFLSLDDDLNAFSALAAADPPFRAYLEVMSGFHQPKFLTPFEVACWAVTGQRLPEAQARKVKRALSARYGGEWKGLPAFPEPSDLAGLTEADLLTLLPNERKVRALVGLTQAFAGVSTADLMARPTDEVQDWLLGLYGIGAWSALFILVRGLGRYELLADVQDDSPFLKELLNAARPVYGELTLAQLRDKFRSYGEQAGYWGIYLRSRTALIQ